MSKIMYLVSVKCPKHGNLQWLQDVDIPEDKLMECPICRKMYIAESREVKENE